MPSFDIISKIDKQELSNAVDQAAREVKNRFDFKDSNAHFVLDGDVVTMIASNKFQLQQMQQILDPKLVKRGIGLGFLEHGVIEESLHEAKQKITIRHGIDNDLGKKINKFIKEAGVKVQSSFMGDHVRVSGKKRDDLQAVMTLLRGEDFRVPMQFENMRD